ncbi:MAG TPA: carbon-nitrogen hydrolase [Candidatus Acidoferrales bacterium]|nr:carbon-nitrogen hydrolase [Candidatus Acidoferrales bacterium]
MTDKIAIGLIQAKSCKDAAANLAHVSDKIREAAKRGAQIVCTHELFRSEYFCRKEDAELFDLAEAVPGPTTEALGRVARENKVAIVASLFERRAPGVYHNTCAVIDADGSFVGKYRKMHIPDDPLYYEKFYFTPGDLGFPNFDTKYGRIAVQICWDQWYPEGARAVALGGAQVIFYPTSIGWHPKEKAEFGAAQLDAWRTIQRGHAIANGVYVAVVNRVGFEGPGSASGSKTKRDPSTASRTRKNRGREKVLRDSVQNDGPQTGDTGIEFWGNSFVADPFGRVVAEASNDKEEVLVVECDPAASEETRRNWPFLRDRRIDAYEPILNRWLGK